MDLSVPATTLAALLLGTARATGFVLLAPAVQLQVDPRPGEGRVRPGAVGAAVDARSPPSLPAPTAGYLVVTTLTEVVIGAALGFVVQVLLHRRADGR